MGVNPNTVSKAYQELERNKIIYSVSGRGSFVSAVEKSNLRENALAEFDRAVNDAIKAGLTPDELKNRIDEVNTNGNS